MSARPTSFTSQQPLRFLVVDDEISNRKLLARVFESYGEVVDAFNGREAVDLLAEQHFDMVLLDIMMPVMTGLEALKVIRSRPETQDIPVILISALNHNHDVVRGLQQGANDYIIKPFDIDVVKARVETQLYLKQLMDTQKQAVIQLEAAQQMKDRLFRIASHDLKSPLMNVKMAEMILRDFVKDEPDAIEVLDTLKNTVNTMNQVIEEFLDMAAMQADGLVLNMQAVSVDELLQDTIAPYHITAGRKGIRLVLGDMDGIAWADAERAAQIISNLVSNAIKYSPHNTQVSIWSEMMDDRVRVHVADEGPGIPASERELLFKEFSRLSPRPTGGESSTGLGLWIVKHMANLQNGDVGVICPLEGGSIFWVEFPAFLAEPLVTSVPAWNAAL